jgi:Arc/MetJ family transcription regulator
LASGRDDETRIVSLVGPDALVYSWCMTRTNVDIDDEACTIVMTRYHLTSKRAAINYALRLVAGEALDLDEARALRGSGWDGDLGSMRATRKAEPAEWS